MKNYFWLKKYICEIPWIYICYFWKIFRFVENTAYLLKIYEIFVNLNTQSSDSPPSTDYSPTRVRASLSSSAEIRLLQYCDICTFSLELVWSPGSTHFKIIIKICWFDQLDYYNWIEFYLLKYNFWILTVALVNDWFNIPIRNLKTVITKRVVLPKLKFHI